MCGSLPGYRAAEFLLEQRANVKFVVNEQERSGHWTLSPFDLGLDLIKEADIPSVKPDLIITVFYHRLLPPDLFKLPPLGAWNLHLADCEKYRGAYPSVRALRNGDTEYSVTIHRIDSGTDTGDILQKLTFPIPADSTGRELYETMTVKGMALLSSCWNDLITGKALGKTRPQNRSSGETMRKGELSHELHPPEELINQVRALTFPPFPPPFFTCGRKKYIVIEDENKKD